MVKANHALSNSALYGVVNNISSVEVLQSDLNKLVVWPDYGRWLSMPASVFCLESLAPEIMCLNNYTYTMMRQPITSVTHSFFAQENLATCVVDETHTIKTWTWLMEWNTYQGHEFEKTFHYCIFAVGRRPEVCCLCLVTAVENVSVQFVFWSLGPLNKNGLETKIW